jgi:hypothetical protein
MHVGYSGQAALRKEQCGMQAESWDSGVTKGSLLGIGVVTVFQQQQILTAVFSQFTASEITTRPCLVWALNAYGTFPCSIKKQQKATSNLQGLSF